MRFSYPADHPLASEFEDQMVKLVCEYVREGEYLSVHHPDEPGAVDDALDSTALALFASKTGKIGEILSGRRNGGRAVAKNFVAYASQPPEVGSTIKAALEILRTERPGHGFQGWEENDIPGRFIVDPILEHIGESEFVVADITRLNFNVTYEIGYAIGKRKRCFLIKNNGVIGDEALIREVGLFDTLGYREYTNSRQLADHLVNVTDVTPLIPAESDVNPKSPVYVVLPKVKSDNEIQLVSRVRKAFRSSYRTFDPDEQGRLAAMDAIRNVAVSHGIVVPLVASTRPDFKVHNIRAAFVAGLAAGMDKELLLLQFGDEPVPLDYRDLVAYVGSAERQLETYFGDFAPAVFARFQTESVRDVSVAKSRLQQLNLGASSAENEMGYLGEYYLETEEFRRVSRGEAQIVTGRKGSGKTALFVRLRDLTRRLRQNVVLDLRPEGFQLLKFKDVVLQYLEAGTKEHTITAFWQYLLLLEICHKILEKDKEQHVKNHKLYGPYHQLLTEYGTDAYVTERDFAERMSKLMSRITRDFKDVIGTGDWKARLSTDELTNILYQHDTKALRERIGEYLQHKDALWILFDNIDKGWPASGLVEEDVLIIRCLIDAMAKLQRDFKKREIETFGVVFLRNDVYEVLIDNTSDRGKVARSILDWTDPEMLRELLRLRFVSNGPNGPNESFEAVWRQICTSHVNGEESSTYIIDRCLMRPRSLIDFLQYCRSHALNLGHVKIQEDDIRKGEESYSAELIANIGFEIRDVFPDAGDVLYEFIGASKKLSHDEVVARLKSGKIEDARIEEMIDLLLWYGVLGVIRDNGEIAYIYTVTYVRKRLKALLKDEPAAQAFYINPAFWVGLEIG